MVMYPTLLGDAGSVRDRGGGIRTGGGVVATTDPIGPGTAVTTTPPAPVFAPLSFWASIPWWVKVLGAAAIGIVGFKLLMRKK